MTIPVEQIRYVYAGPYGVGNIVPIPFDYVKEEHIRVYINKELLEFNVDYSILGQNVTLYRAVATEDTVTVCRETPLDQDSDFPQEAEFDSQKITDALDKLTMQNQEQDELLSRAIKLPIDTPLNISDFDLPLPEAGKALKWSDDESALVNSTYKIDDIATEAKQYADTAAQQAAVASQKATEAISSANLAASAVTKVDAATEDALNQISEAAKSGAENVQDDIKSAAENAKQEVADSAQDILDTAESWAIGDATTRPEGSAKWWAEQTAQLIQGDTYTKNETDALLAKKADTFSAGFGVVLEDSTLSIDPDAFNLSYVTPDDLNVALTDGLATKQDKLTAGTNIYISSDGVISATGGGGSSVDAYTKEETDALLLTKQAVLSAGTNMSISGSVISCTLDSYTKTETLGLLNTKQNTLTPGSYISISGNTISATPEAMVQVFTQSEWDAASDATKNAAILALIVEE